MAKYETRIKADFDHLSEYLDNSIRRHYNLPIVINDYCENNVRIQIKFFDIQPPSHITVLTGKKGEEYLYLEILETGFLGQRMVIEDSGDKFAPRMQKIIDAYNPLAPKEENSYLKQTELIKSSEKSDKLPQTTEKRLFYINI